MTLRPEEAGDEPLLFQLYASTREEELALTGWDEPTRTQFLQGQFRAQRTGYRSMFPTADFAILVLDAAAAGRIVVQQTPAEIRLVDLIIAPALRHHGLGTALMQSLFSEAARRNKPVRLHVFQNNRAALWYQRLGFRSIGTQGVHDEMEWRAGFENVSAASLKLPLMFEAAGLQADLQAILAKEFIPHFNKGYYEGDCSGYARVTVLQNPDRLILETADEFGVTHLSYTVSSAGSNPSRTPTPADR